MNLSLFDISTEFRVLDDMMQDEFDFETGELIDNSEALASLYNDIKLTLEEKLDNTQRYLLTLQSEEDTLATEIKRLSDKKKAISNKQDKLKQLVLSALHASGHDKIKTPLYSFFIRKTESVNIINEEAIPRLFMVVKYSPDKTKIKKFIKDGNSVEGASINENESLGVR